MTIVTIGWLATSSYQSQQLRIPSPLPVCGTPAFLLWHNETWHANRTSAECRLADAIEVENVLYDEGLQGRRVQGNPVPMCISASMGCHFFSLTHRRTNIRRLPSDFMQKVRDVFWKNEDAYQRRTAKCSWPVLAENISTPFQSIEVGLDRPSDVFHYDLLEAEVHQMLTDYMEGQWRERENATAITMPYCSAFDV